MKRQKSQLNPPSAKNSKDNQQILKAPLLQTLQIPFNLLTPNTNKTSSSVDRNGESALSASRANQQTDYHQYKSQILNKTQINDEKEQLSEVRSSKNKSITLDFREILKNPPKQTNLEQPSISKRERLKQFAYQDKLQSEHLNQYADQSQEILEKDHQGHSLSKDDLAQLFFSKEQLNDHISYIENMWQYRYTSYLEDAVFNKRWMRLFSFLGEFKEKCIDLLKKMVNCNFSNFKCLEEIDHRFNMKNQGEDGIYMVDAIIIRVAKIKNDKSANFNDSVVKGLHQEYLAYNVLNNLCISLLNTDFQTVRVPLTVLVKYHGYTALCQADTPCQGLETLIHGPTATIYQYRQESMPILRAIGQQLNLKEFRMQAKDGKVLSVPFSLTVELHKVNRQFKNQNVIDWIDPKSVLYPSNNKTILEKPEYYLINIRKLWPLFIDSNIVKSSGYLRPEVVLSWKTKLSNTVFSNVSYRQHPNSELELADACKNLKEDNVKILARMLDDTTIFLIDSQGIEQIMHQYGVNMRFMGQLARRVTLEFSKKVLQTQMIARTCKKFFFRALDDLSLKDVKDINTHLKQNFVDFLNLIFIRNEEAEMFYRKYIYGRIQSYYEYEIKEYPPHIPGGGLLHAIAYHFGIKVKVIDYPFFQAGVDSIFNTSHITDIIGYAKIFDMQTSEVKLLCRKFKEKRKKNSIKECISELKILAAINKNLNHQKTHNIGSYRESFFYAQLAEIYFSEEQYQEARKYAQISLKSIPQKHADSIKPFGVLIKYYSVKKQTNRCIQYYQKSLSYLGYHLSPDHPLTISVYNTLGYEFVSTMDPAKCEKIFMKSFQICEQALGYMHHTSSQILMQLAGLPLPPEKTINFLLQSLTILENLGQHQKLMQEVSMRISEQYSKLGNIQKMIYFARKSGHWKMEIKGQDKLNHDRTVFELTHRQPANQDQVIFLIFYAVKSYLNSMDQVQKDNLYKMFININDELLSKDHAADILLKRLSEDKSSINHVSDFVKNNFQSLIREIPRMLQKDFFYTFKLENREKIVKGFIDIFIEIMSVIGKDQVTLMFMSYKKTV